MDLPLPEINIVPFRPRFQQSVKDLILAGLAEHWGIINPGRNPDLEDIGRHYGGAVFLVAMHGKEVIGCGALVPRSAQVGQIVRMSVATGWRCMGIGRMILEALTRHAFSIGYGQLVLETTDTWVEAIAFYLRAGFRVTHWSGGDLYFVRDLS